jgi:hypothetical protein
LSFVSQDPRGVAFFLSIFVWLIFEGVLVDKF